MTSQTTTYSGHTVFKSLRKYTVKWFLTPENVPVSFRWKPEDAERLTKLWLRRGYVETADPLQKKEPLALRF